MRYKDTGFRALYHRFACFPIHIAKGIVKDYPGYEEANTLLVYGYIDHEAGLTLEAIACGVSDTEGARFFDTNNKIKAMVRIGDVMEEEFNLLENEEPLRERYQEKLDILSGYDVNEEIEESRSFAFLDTNRHEMYPDDVSVHIVREGLQPEICWARIEGLQQPQIIATLLNEPNQDFGYHIGDKIGFSAHETEENEIILVCDMTPSKVLCKKDLVFQNLNSISLWQSEWLRAESQK